MAIDFYAFIEIERYGSDRLGFALPEGETILTPDGIGVLKNAPNPDLACLFVEYVLSEGQRLWILKKGLPGGPVENALCRFPVDATLYEDDPARLSVTKNPYRVGSGLRYDGKTGGRRWAILGDLVATVVIAPHDELKQCWREVIRRGLKPSEYRRYFTLDLSEEKAFELAADWDRPEFARERIRLMNAWTAEARRRYRSVDSY
jgi:hypothetical protein